MNIGIVGGGIAGLTAAYRLSGAGHKVKVFEANNELGGLAQGFTLAGSRLDKFYRHIFKSDTDIIKLVDELGLTDKLWWIESKVGFYYKKKIYNFTTPMDLLRFSPLSILGRIKLGLMSLYLARVKKWKKYEKITVKEWIEKYIGKKVYKVVWGALLEQKFGDKANDIAMAWLYGRIHARFASREKGGTKEVLGYMLDGFQTLIDELESVNMKQGTVFLKGMSGNRVFIENGTAVGLEARGVEYKFDKIILTCAPALIKHMVEFPDKAYMERLGKIQYYGALNLVMAVKKSLSKIYWLNMGDRQSPFVAAVEHTNFISKQHYNNNVIIYLGKYLSTEDALYKAPNEEVKEIFFTYLKQMNPLFDPQDVIEWRVFREPFSQPVIEKEYSKIKLDYKTPIKNLYIANMSQVYPEDRGMSYSIRVANEVSDIILKEK